MILDLLALQHLLVTKSLSVVFKTYEWLGISLRYRYLLRPQGVWLIFWPSIFRCSFLPRLAEGRSWWQQASHKRLFGRGGFEGWQVFAKAKDSRSYIKPTLNEENDSRSQENDSLGQSGMDVWAIEWLQPKKNYLQIRLWRRKMTKFVKGLSHGCRIAVKQVLPSSCHVVWFLTKN